MMTDIKEKRTSILALVLVLAISLFAFTGCTSSRFAVAVGEVTEDGNVVLKTTLLDFNERGVNLGDKVEVKIGEFSTYVTLTSEIIEESGLIQLWCDTESSYMVLTVYGERFADSIDVSAGDMVRVTTE